MSECWFVLVAPLIIQLPANGPAPLIRTCTSDTQMGDLNAVPGSVWEVNQKMEALSVHLSSAV